MAEKTAPGELTLFDEQDGRIAFEDLGRTNGSRYWMESDLRRALGYQGEAAFRRVVTKAMQACLSLGIPTEENFSRDESGEYKLTRFGCYLVAMNGDPKKPPVAVAQLYFAHLAESFQAQIQTADNIDRLLIREEMADGQKALHSTAKLHGVENYAFFQNAGYRGMYNMNLTRLSEFKGLPQGEKLLDRMGKDELAANLFRVTQTDAKIRNENIRGQVPLERAATDVGRTVRETMTRISGTPPEQLPLADHVREVKKSLKATSKGFRQIDLPAPPPAKPKKRLSPE